PTATASTTRPTATAGTEPALLTDGGLADPLLEERDGGGVDALGAELGHAEGAEVLHAQDEIGVRGIRGGQELAPAGDGVHGGHVADVHVGEAAGEAEVGFPARAVVAVRAVDVEVGAR